MTHQIIETAQKIAPNCRLLQTCLFRAASRSAQRGGGDTRLVSPPFAGYCCISCHLSPLRVYMVEADSHEPCARHRVRLSGLLRCGDTLANLQAHQRLSHREDNTRHGGNAVTPAAFRIMQHEWGGSWWGGRTARHKGVPLPLLRARTAARDENHAEAAGCQRGDPLAGKRTCTRARTNERATAHLLSRQQIHSADEDEFGDVCTATIFPGAAV